MKTAILLSTSGSVVRSVAAQSAAFRESLSLFVSDRSCPGLQVGEELGVRTRILPAPDNLAFSDALLAALTEATIEYVYVFYTRVLCGELLQRFADRLVNFHPSLLPACPGLDGFGDSLSSGAIVIGSTVHFIDSRTDAGPQIMQSFLPVAPGAPRDSLRHQLFAQQCRCLIQVHEWLLAGRLQIEDSRVTVRDGFYAPGEFVPNLDSSIALDFETSRRDE